jgi:hypothetical protein
MGKWSDQAKQNAEKRRRKIAEFNAATRGAGYLVWVFHPASEKHPEITQIVFHYTGTDGKKLEVSIPNTSKPGAVGDFLLVMPAVNVFELENTETPETVTVLAKVRVGWKAYGNGKHFKRKCVRIEWFVVGYSVRAVNGSNRNEWHVSEKPGKISRIGCPGFKDGKTKIWGHDNGGFWLENKH